MWEKNFKIGQPWEGKASHGRQVTCDRSCVCSSSTRSVGVGMLGQSTGGGGGDREKGDVSLSLPWGSQVSPWLFL